MSFNIFKNTVLLFLLIMISCGNNVQQKSNQINEILNHVEEDRSVIVGANQTEHY